MMTLGDLHTGDQVSVQDYDVDVTGYVVRASNASVDVEIESNGSVWRFWQMPLVFACARFIRDNPR
jgi:hypothetical protein